MSLRFSPDGRAIAWVADDTGALEVYVAPRDRPGSKLRVSTSGGSWPTFSYDGRELFYLSQDGRLMAVGIHTTPTVTAGKSEALFRTGGRGWRSFDVAANGRFLAIVKQVMANEQPLNLVLNWAPPL